MPQIDLTALADSLAFGCLPKNVRHSLLNSLRQGFLLVPLHPTRADGLKCSCESLLYWFLLGSRGLAPAAGGRNELSRQPTGLVGGQEYSDRRDVRGVSDAAEGSHGKDLLLV